MNIDDLYEMSNWIAISPRALVITCVIFLLLGWIFPVEGPFDDAYEAHKKAAVKAGPAVKENTPEEDLDTLCDLIEKNEPYYYMYCRN